MNDLAYVYWSQGRYAEAEKLYGEALEIQRRVRGQDHWETLQAMHTLAGVYMSQERYAEAEKLCKETVEIQRRVLGQDHPDTLSSVHGCLGYVHYDQGRYAEAEKLWKETLEIRRRVLGQAHPDTLGSMYDLACAAALRGDRRQGLDWLTQAVDHGYSDAESMAQDEDLTSLRDEPAFEALLARARENEARPR
jgi:tetratricopeptide (TPR) repeat protein